MLKDDRPIAFFTGDRIVEMTPSFELILKRDIIPFYTDKTIKFTDLNANWDGVESVIYEDENYIIEIKQITQFFFKT
jgi:hypothetical protein